MPSLRPLACRNAAESRKSLPASCAVPHLVAAHRRFCRSAKDFEEAFNMAQMQLQDAERQIADVRLPLALPGLAKPVR